MSCYNRDLDRSVGVCFSNALGLVRTVRQISRATPSGFDFLFRTRPRALGKQPPPPPRTGLNPLNNDTVTKKAFQTCMLTIHVSGVGKNVCLMGPICMYILSPMVFINALLMLFVML